MFKTKRYVEDSRRVAKKDKLILAQSVDGGKFLVCFELFK